MDVYNNPKYYELAFSFRDIAAEADFIEKLIARYSTIPVNTFLELASGNSPHLQELSKRGYRYVGLELNTEMVDYARDRIKESNLSGIILQGDMVEFSVKEPVDCVLVFLGSLYVKSDEELNKHLNSVAKSVKSGGLYILDGVVSFYHDDVHTQLWEIKEGDIKILVTYKAAWVNANERLMRGTITLNVEDGRVAKKIEHSEIRKVYSASELVAQAEQTGLWKEVEAFSNFDIDNGPREGARNILVLQRK